MMRQKNSVLLIVVLCAIATGVAQEPAIAVGQKAEMSSDFYSKGIRYGEGKSDSLFVRWAHSAEADSFWVYKDDNSLLFVSDKNIKTVWYSKPVKYERRMATHHLKEFIFDSPLRFRDLLERNFLENLY
ncbi:hypothetical protein AGMMS49938_08190 [Fibrobacterales bacterium]|nr:hypothetical protein AGMMS49938_08190 [Fibrobacterales bacterium]